jgi:hypothetical protein
MPDTVGGVPLACEFYVTFGQRYAREPHPTFPAAHPDGYVVIVAPSEPIARAAAFSAFGTAWAFIYERPPEPRFAPRGELARLVASIPDGSRP